MLWIAGFSLLILILPRRLAVILALAVAMGHAAGAGMWFSWRFQLYWAYPVLFLASAALIVWTWEKSKQLSPGG